MPEHPLQHDPAQTLPSAPLRQRLLRRATRLAVPARLLLAACAVTAGALLIFAPFTVQQLALVTGLGLVVAGIVGVSQASRTPAPRLSRWAAALVLVLGTLMALWPHAGAPWLAFLVGSALVVHGGVSLVSAIRGRVDQRTAGALGSIATLIIGTVTFSWPVLTLTVFRWGIGAWFIFLGLQLVFLLALGREHRTHSLRNTPGRIRRWSHTIAAALALLLAAGAAYGSGLVLGGSPMPEPGPFYSAPSTMPNTAGQLLRSEPLTSGVPAGAVAWKILYTTTHPDGTPAVSSGTIIAPASRDDRALPLITVAHGTTGVAPKCAPSLSATPFADGAGTALAELVTKHGWAAVTSDYIGLGTAGTHPYLIGDAEARNVLDASLAAQQLSELSIASRTVVWGHSQGGQGALWAGQIAADYAPGLTIEGVAAFAPAADLYGLADADKNEAAGKTVSAYIAATWNTIYPDLELSSHLTPGSAGGVAKIQDLCFNGSDVLSAILYGTQTPNQIFPDSLLDGAFGKRLHEQTPVGPFPAPVMVAQGLDDPLVKPPLQHAWVEARCKAGDAIDYRTYPGLDHNSLVAANSPLTPQLVQWTLDRWDDKPSTPNCQDLPQ